MERRQKWNISSVQVIFACLFYASKEILRRLRSEILFFIINTMIFIFKSSAIARCKVIQPPLKFSTSYEP